MVYAVSMDSNFGENLNSAWGKTPVINENFGSVQLHPRQKPMQQQQPVQHQKPMQPVRQPVQHQKPMQQQQAVQLPKFQNQLGYHIPKNNKQHISLVVLFVVFILFTCINSSISIYDKDKPSTILNMVFYIIFSILLIVNSVMIIL